jgi:hypothetical protein
MRLGTAPHSSPASPDEPGPAARVKPPAPLQVDRTTLVVRLGLLVLAVTGVVTIFGDVLFGVGVGKDVPSGSVTPPMPELGAQSARP